MSIYPDPTVVVLTENGPVIIDKAVYDANPESYTLVDADTPVVNEGDQQSVTVEDEPVDVTKLFVLKDGSKFFVHNISDGAKVSGVAGIDEGGYRSEKAANEAIEALRG